MQQKYNLFLLLRYVSVMFIWYPMLMHKSQYYVHVYNISLHDQPCMEVVYLEFNTLHSTRIYAHSSTKAYFERYHSDYAIF